MEEYSVPTLSSIILESKDGEWGKEEPFENSTEMIVIRGTDFDKIQLGCIDEIPRRYIKSNIALRKSLKPNDILIETAGGTKDQPTGKTIIIKPSVLKKSDLPVTCASFSRFIRIDSTKADPNFVFRKLQFMHKYGIMAKYNVQHTGLSRFQWTNFSNYEPFELPSLPIQKKIASVLASLDNKIEINTRINKVLEDIARALFHRWFVEFEFPDAEGRPYKSSGGKMVESEMGSVPAGWVVETINDVVKISGGSTPSTKNPKYWEQGKNPFCTPKDLSTLNSTILLDTERHITDEGVQSISSKQLPKGTVLLSSRAPVGYLAISSVPVSVNQGFIALVCDEDVSNNYLLQWLRENMEIIEGRANGSTFQEISKKNFRTIPFLIPANEILNWYNSIANPIYKKITILTKEMNDLSLLRDSLLPKLMSGELSVPMSPPNDVETGDII